ncbi:uncharacterized protein LOC127860222 [Dreissena polymorpha]|uniref:B box-type domain-containing protein n=1 Tax=Dreissena polymorpha TaxID=45954 RepID=A0A9D3YNI3_DREPO|nr:uncharacterized protein LOC127860222 [Dreissena polymorpha]XP_052254109.1 uncharacterized protein LOC127860222 [Dreissena polymorpha]XP_052254110.1 uncharacterized protein LOC127860222 [Dreissena polymorpha]XP_052254111.1 uncharacterized protein LOC127860222 [Dreissena polymorpha]XP_052254112.1 uncharacterized protein LOC127860222 [Dreissena polymorpha]KAH3703827.1 hypothetical protein DPMN_078874 [Dreissena polymorpha]
MATFPQSNLYKGSDMFQDFLCSTCEDNKLDKTADFYCESCMKFYCRNCINMHHLLFTKHSPFGRGDMKKWPVAKKVEDFVLKCDVHKEENLKMLCDDHNDLCCTKCAFLKHRHCRKVNFISELVKSRNTDLQKLSLSILTILEEMKELQGNQEASIRYVQSSYDEQLLTIQETRQKIIAAFNKIEQKTLKEMKDTLTKLQAASKSDGDKCIRLWDELQQLRDAIQDIGDKSNQELSFIAAKKCEDIIQQSETFLEKNSLQFKVSITFQPNSGIVHYLSNLSGLGRIEHSAQNPNKVLTLQGKSVQNVRISRDSTSCHITAICVLPDGQVLVADMDNKKIKLVDEQYQVVSHWSVTAYPKDICQITPSEVAVTVDDTNTNEVQFITVNKRQLVTGRKLQLQHTCNGIACHQEDLYITSDTALYKYKLSGKLVRKMYKDTSGNYTVSRCAVNPTGEKLYIINFSHGKLLTLASNGSVLATFSDPALEGPRCVHVTPAGQVLVCGGGSSTILQVDIRGRRKLASLASRKDGVVSPWSVCYNRHTASMIVGLYENSNILVFKVQ